MFSLIIPVFNEEQMVEQTVRKLHECFSAAGGDFEIVVVDDGSTDRTAEILQSITLPAFSVVRHDRNHGNGAAIRSGVRAAHGTILGTVDADGTYPLAEYPRLVHIMQGRKADMLVGARTKGKVAFPWNRRPAKAVIGMLANILVGMRIPDINSGMRIFSRSLYERYQHLYPQRFSFHMTITLAALTNGYSVHFEPIEYYERTGASTMSAGFNGPLHFASFLGLIVRITTYFRPMKFFVWPGALLFLLGCGYISSTLATSRTVTAGGVLLVIVGLQFVFFGIILENVVRHRDVSRT